MARSTAKQASNQTNRVKRDAQSGRIVATTSDKTRPAKDISKVLKDTAERDSAALIRLANR